MFYNINGDYMYFDSLLANLILMIVIILIITIINYYLNHHARVLMKYASTLKISSKEIVDRFSKEENIDLKAYSSRGNNILDNYIDSNKTIFINARHYYSSSIYTLARTVYFCAMSKVAKNDNKKFKLQNKCDSIFTLLDVLAWGLFFIGILLKINLLIIASLIMLLTSFIFVLINYKTIKSYHHIALEYLSKLLKDKKEVNVIKVIYLFECIQYLLKPFLSLVLLFPFLLSINQKKMSGI